MKTIFISGLAVVIALSACDQNRNKATLSNSTDTNNVTKAGGPPIRDTSTINKDRQDSARTGKNNTAKGNADPTGRIKNQ